MRDELAALNAANRPALKNASSLWPARSSLSGRTPALFSRSARNCIPSGAGTLLMMHSLPAGLMMSPPQDQMKISQKEEVPPKYLGEWNWPALATRLAVSSHLSQV